MKAFLSDSVPIISNGSAAATTFAKDETWNNISMTNKAAADGDDDDDDDDDADDDEVAEGAAAEDDDPSYNLPCLISYVLKIQVHNDYQTDYWRWRSSCLSPFYNELRIYYYSQTDEMSNNKQCLDWLC